MRPEAELLFCCARTRLEAATTERIRTVLAGEVDWEYLISLADRNGVIPLLYHHLIDMGSDGVPSIVTYWMSSYVEKNSRRTHAIVGELLILLSLFELHGIAAIPYKGPILSIFAYGDLELRTSGDLDIVVHKQDVLRAKEIMLSRGYHPVPRLTPEQEQAHIEHECEYNFQREDGHNFRVEIHWQFASNSYNFQFDMERVWPRLRPLRLRDREVSTFGLEDLLLALCFHGIKHYWRRLQWLCDFSEIIKLHGDDMDWEGMLLHANKLRIRRALFIALYLARDLLGVRVPESVEEQMQRDILAESLAHQLAQQFVTEIPYSWEADLMLLFKAREHIVDQVRSYWLPIITKKYAEAFYEPSVRKWRIPPLLYWSLFAKCLYSRYVTYGRYGLLQRKRQRLQPNK